ncbi:hypothetical protein AMTRI_Chr11g157730 [Amborella trichopoda]|uniref:Bifunctional inhibitor/plant lipid transfer protein/seed storage helical domain-containing protein n=1 Tax=Amborella trichopoda TaxID=13333 RepID=U5DHL6_AMBTC|nr:uncharacterized protein LOC18448408 [Amborella trichopoda]ERN19998.1 hypothetical protein AMTR_s00071p00157070 [Amborella trichopoda]|eukprot:XP_006858531.3 uncharacterized protein LOC18448408 [Amborella trichopoda]
MDGKWWWCLELMLVVAMVVAWEEAPLVGAVSAAQCKGEVSTAVHACISVVYRGFPSPECCAIARTAHTECICPKVTPKLAALVDVRRAVRLVEGCGRRVPRHFKCGSVTTP